MVLTFSQKLVPVLALVAAGEFAENVNKLPNILEKIFGLCAFSTGLC
jgi:hypothetical protein